LIDSVFLCDDPVGLLNQPKEITFEKGLPIDLVLKVIKWLFIEQDVILESAA
jgi:hypothetical protein